MQRDLATWICISNPSASSGTPSPPTHRLCFLIDAWLSCCASTQGSIHWFYREPQGFSCFSPPDPGRNDSVVVITPLDLKVSASTWGPGDGRGLSRDLAGTRQVVAVGGGPDRSFGVCMACAKVVQFQAKLSLRGRKNFSHAYQTMAICHLASG